MCTSHEASDRTAFKELSQLECTSSTYHRAHPRDRRPDPFKCVKKYRRSAAGGGVNVNVNVNDNDKHESRSILDLEISADYLIGRIFANQQSDHDGMEESVSPTSTSTSTSTCCQYQLSLAQTANFVDDRLRAVQVDLTTLLGRMEMEQMDRHEHAGTSISGSTSGSGSISGNDISSISSTISGVRKIQVKLIRYNILAQHMLSGLGSDRYQWSFAQKALTTAISSYFATFHAGTGHAHGTAHGTGHGTGHAHAHGHAQQPENMGYEKDLDEIMSYAALLHIATLVKKNEMALPQTSSTGQQCGLALDGGTGISAILGLYKRYVNVDVDVDVNVDDDVNVNVNHVTSTTDSASYPKYQWALQVASAIENGEFLSALRLLRPPMSTSTSMSMSTSTTSIGIRTKETSQWEIMSRCCVAQVVPLLRIGLLRRYNKSYGKNEKVADTDVSVYTSDDYE
jgi:hypothetical protein